MYKLFVSIKEFEAYQLKRHKGIKIHDFWKLIIKNAPITLEGELRRKFTDLIRSEENDTKEFEAYIFRTKNSSEKLKKYLEQFIVYKTKISKITINK